MFSSIAVILSFNPLISLSPSTVHTRHLIKRVTKEVTKLEFVISDMLKKPCPKHC